MVVGDGMYAKMEGDADPLGQASLKPGSQYRRGGEAAASQIPWEGARQAEGAEESSRAAVPPG